MYFTNVNNRVLSFFLLSRRSSDSMNSAVSAEELVVPPPIAKPTEEELHFNNIIFSTETHSNYYSEDLVKHKVNSPVEQLEKQVKLNQIYSSNV